MQTTAPWWGAPAFFIVSNSLNVNFGLLGSRHRTIRFRSPPSRPDGHVNFRLYDWEYGSTSLRDVQVRRESACNERRAIIINHSVITESLETTLSPFTWIMDEASVGLSTTRFPFWRRCCSAALSDHPRWRCCWSEYMFLYEFLISTSAIIGRSAQWEEMWGTHRWEEP